MFIRRKSCLVSLKYLLTLWLGVLGDAVLWSLKSWTQTLECPHCSFNDQQVWSLLEQLQRIITNCMAHWWRPYHGPLVFQVTISFKVDPWVEFIEKKSITKCLEDRANTLCQCWSQTAKGGCWFVSTVQINETMKHSVACSESCKEWSSKNDKLMWCDWLKPWSLAQWKKNPKLKTLVYVVYNKETIDK